MTRPPEPPSNEPSQPSQRYPTSPYGEQYGQPQYGPPQYGPPHYGQAQYRPPQYGPPQYGQPQYGPQYAPPSYAQPEDGPSQYGPRPLPTSGPATGSRLADRLGPRALRRPEPRFGISLAAAGVALATAGILIWTIGYLGDGFHVSFDDRTGATRASGGGRRFLGVGLSLALTAAGYALVMRRRHGPLATAGVIGSAVGVPLTLIFITLNLDIGSAGSNFPINDDVVFLLSIVMWLVSYLMLPGTRGRAVYLGLAASFLASYVEYKTAGTLTQTLGSVVSTPVSGASTGAQDTGGIATVGLGFGLAYYGAAALLDRRGRSGAAIGLVYAGFVTTATGVAASVASFGQLGTGIELVVLGAVLSFYGGRFGRRFTTWIWAAAFVVGIAAVVQRIARHSTAATGITLIVLGALVVAGAQVFSTVTREPAEIPADGARHAVATAP